MSKAKEISEFVKKALNTFSISEHEYFYSTDPKTGERIPRDLFSSADINGEVIGRLSVALGIDKQDIIEMNEAPLKAYYSEYPFFGLYRRYLEESERQREFSDGLSTEERLVAAIFGDKSGLKIEKRYDVKAIKQRLIKQLYEIDSLIPGTYHQDATLCDLAAETEYIISYPSVTELMRSFLQMVDEAGDLFFKGIDTELSKSEAQRFNFLCSTLEIFDIIMPSVRMSYTTLKKYRSVYKAEGMSEFTSYVRVRRFVDDAPWRCREFLDDKELVQRFVNYFPYEKSRIREFVMDVSRFACRFRWSDAKPLELDEWDEIIYEEWGLDTNERPLEWTRVYVPKTDDELFDWKPYIQKLSRAASPEKKGGLKAPKSEWSVKGFTNPARMMARVGMSGGAR